MQGVGVTVLGFGVEGMRAQGLGSRSYPHSPKQTMARWCSAVSTRNQIDPEIIVPSSG